MNPERKFATPWNGIQLEADDVHVWLLPCAQPREILRRLYAILDSDERRRADRYRFDRHRDRFIASRGAVRQLLAEYVGCSPEAIEFEFGERGKPRLAGYHASAISFNMSISRDWALLGLNLEREIGIDIERIDSERADRDIVSHYFAPGEIVELETLQDRDWLQGFFNCWTRKEAFIKATGEGLYRALDSFEVSLAPGESVSLLRVENCAVSAGAWQMRDLAKVPGYAGALVVEGSIGRVHTFTWVPR
jgi:4'-phosphopantetheinyl transferase